MGHGKSDGKTRHQSPWEAERRIQPDCSLTSRGNTRLVLPQGWVHRFSEQIRMRTRGTWIYLYGNNMKHAINTIISAVAEEFGITTKALCGKTRAEAVAIPRMVAMELVWKHCGITYQTVANHFGKRQHGTVFHARKRVHFMLDNNKAFATAYRNIEAKINL